MRPGSAARGLSAAPPATLLAANPRAAASLATPPAAPPGTLPAATPAAATRAAAAPLAVAMLAAAMLAACASVGPNFVPPQEKVPDHYSGEAPPPAVPPPPPPVQRPPDAPGAPAPTVPPPPPPTTLTESDPDSFWWREFHDPELERLVDLTLAGNLDLKAAYLRFVEARLQVQNARAQGLPSLNGVASFNREQLGLAGVLKQQGFNVGPSDSAATQSLVHGIEAPIDLYQLGFDASWELDLFGRVRRSVEAAKAQSVEVLEARNDMLVSLAAEAAQDYFQLRAAQVLRRITLDQIASQRDIVDLTQSRFLHGLANEADLQSARGQLASLTANLPPYDQTIASSRHALAVLTGQQPEALDAEFGETGDLPDMPADIPVGVPSTLARRRPDIRNAEAALHAATAQVGVSVAALFPDISLTGTFGLRNLGTHYLFDWSSKFYTFGPSVSIPIFHGGALVTSVRVSKAAAAEAALQYRKTVLGALQDVEDGLTSIQEDALATAALSDTVNADQRALDVDLDAYGHGIITYITVLTQQLQSVQARQQLAKALLTQRTDLVKLYKALGGGWEAAPAVAQAAGAP